MKFLDNFFKTKVEKHFTGNGKFKKLYPLYEGLYTFFYVGADKTKTGSHVRDFFDLKRMMILVVIALLPCLILGMYNVGAQQLAYLEGYNPEIQSFYSYILEGNIGFFNAMFLGAQKIIPIMFVVYTAGGIIEVLFSIIRKHEINEGFFVTGMLITLILPPTIPLWQAALASIFGVFIGKEIFGGTGMNILNPALTARAFLFFSYPADIVGSEVWIAPNYVDKPVGFMFNGISENMNAINQATALGQAADVNQEVVFNGIDAFLGFIPGSIGETSVLACLFGAALLLLTGIASWRVMLATLIGGSIFVLLMQFLLGILIDAKVIETSFNMHILSLGLEHLLYGGFAFGLVFMCTDPVSSCATNTGKWIFGLSVGALAMLIRMINPAYPEGMMLAILFMNVFAPFIDYLCVKSNKKRRMTRAV